MADVRIKYKVDKGELVLARKELDKINKEIGVTKKQSNQASGAIKAVGGAIVAAFTIDKLIDFGRQVVSITAEFDKLRAVLTNTLGSKSQADAAFRRLQEFASKTPFQVTQLTNSFVKLANQGFIPTNKELTKLGDLAASTGKDFDQLTEAIIDAQTGEFERLKEFGIRASKEGDRVTFTFKGVQEQVDFTSESIKGYILSLGELEGVSGAMSAISKTLGGQISNLQDSFDSLFYALGQASGGIIADVLTALNVAVETVTRIINAANGITGQTEIELNKLNEEFGKLETAQQYEAAITKISERIEGLKNNLSENVTQAQLLKSSQSDATAAFDQQGAIIDTLSNKYTDYTKQQEQLFENLKDTSEATDDVTDSTQKGTQSYSEANTTITEQSIQLAALENFLKALKKDYDALTNSVNEFGDAMALSEKFTFRLIDTIRMGQMMLNEMGGQTKDTIEDIENFTLEGLDAIRSREEEELERFSQIEQQKRDIAQATADTRLAIEEDVVRGSAGLFSVLRKEFEEGAQALLVIEKALAIADIIIQLQREIAAIAATNAALGPLGIPLTAAQVARAKVRAGIGIATVGAQAMVQAFEEGVINLQGGVKGKDSVPALLMPGESVMTTAETRNFMPTLKAIRENSIDPEVLNAVAEGKGGGSKVFNNVVEVPRDQFVWDEDGFSYYMNRKNITVQRKGVRYKC